MQTGPCRAPAAGTEQNEGGFHNKPSEASEANRTNSEADAVKMFAFGKVAASREGGRAGCVTPSGCFQTAFCLGKIIPLGLLCFLLLLETILLLSGKNWVFSVAVPLTGSQPRLCSQPSCPAGAGEVTSKS